VTLNALWSKLKFIPVISDALLLLIRKMNLVVVGIVSRSISYASGCIELTALIVFAIAPILNREIGAFASAVDDELPTVVEDVIALDELGELISGITAIELLLVVEISAELELISSLMSVGELEPLPEQPAKMSASRTSRKLIFFILSSLCYVSFYYHIDVKVKI
jgi:hypothetical protein